MKWLPPLREGLITAWHAVLDYDRKIPAAKREQTADRRATARRVRLAIDDQREKSRKIRTESERQQREERDLQVEVLPPVPAHHVHRDASPNHHPQYQLPPIRRGLGYCPACGSHMRKGSRATDSGSGCLIVIVGLVLAPILCGIPLILIGLHYMSKRQGFWSCPRCGMETGRKVGFFEFSF